MSWPLASAILELRSLLSDGPEDKLAHRKAVFGDINGSNKKFKTLEFRRVQTLVGAVAPLGVYVNNVSVSVAADDLPSGEFELTTAPTDGQEVRATYYYWWFNDAELAGFLLNAARFLSAAEDITLIPAGLRQAALQYAAQDGYQKLAARWSQRLSDVYRVEDMVKDQPAENPFMSLAKDCRKCAQSLRDDFYKRQGQQLEPAFSAVYGRVSAVVPKR